MRRLIEEAVPAAVTGLSKGWTCVSLEASKGLLRIAVEGTRLIAPSIAGASRCVELVLQLCDGLLCHVIVVTIVRLRRLAEVLDGRLGDVSAVELLVHASDLIAGLLQLCLELVELSNVHDDGVWLRGRCDGSEIFSGWSDRDGAVGGTVLVVGRGTLLTEALQERVNDRWLIVTAGLDLNLLDPSAGLI